ncbi:hypothetical protein [Pollutibacter soli]|uniref:hypothetical protein n=1 Tax=Pollutibacter soli TaxID=3034157 RepID=UPI003013F7FF
MIEIFQRVWENLLSRTEGPLNLRFFIQPTVSVIFAILAAVRDSKAGTMPYLERFILSKRSDKRDIAKEVWKDVGKIFIVGTILDIIYQLVVIFSKKTENYFYPLESLIVAFILAVVPYLLLRGPVNRVIKLFEKKDNEHN